MATTISDPGFRRNSTCRRAAMEQHLSAIIVAGPDAINDRLCDLSREWSAGRMVKASTGLFILAGLALAITVNWWFVLMPAMGGLLLAQYLIARHSLLSRLFIGLGFRSGSEIQTERLSLRTLRGDFRCLPTVDDVEDRDAVSRLEGEGGIAIDPELSKKDAREAVKEILETTKE